MRIILCGFGVVGQSLVKLFDSRSEDLYAKYGLKPRIVGVSDSKGSAVDPSGLEFSKLVEVKKKFGTVKNYANTKNTMSGIDMLKNIEADVLIETTASNYKDAEPGMTHITTAMKKRPACDFCKQRSSGISISITSGTCHIQSSHVKI